MTRLRPGSFTAGPAPSQGCARQDWPEQSCCRSRIEAAILSPQQDCQGRTRPAPGPHVGVEFVTGHVCFFRTLRRLFSSFSNSENLQILRRTPAQHPTCEFEEAHRLSSFSNRWRKVALRPKPRSRPRSDRSRGAGLAFPWRTFRPQRESGDEAVTSLMTVFLGQKAPFWTGSESPW